MSFHFETYCMWLIEIIESDILVYKGLPLTSYPHHQWFMHFKDLKFYVIIDWYLSNIHTNLIFVETLVRIIVQHVVYHLVYCQRDSRWVTRLLTPFRKQECVECAKNMLTLYHRDEKTFPQFLRSLLEVESWLLPNLQLLQRSVS